MTMATYKVWLTVKDHFGNTKEVDGGNITIDFDELTDVDIAQAASKLDPYFTTDAEVAHAVENNDTIKYSDLKLRPEN
jgi:hypothetical protein